MQRQNHKILVVCSDSCTDFNGQLGLDGWFVHWASDAKTAITKVRGERFDLAVLISTGQEMDLTETLFNLRDIRPSMPIAILQPASDLDGPITSASHWLSDNNLIAVPDLSALASLLQTHHSLRAGLSP